MVYKLLLRFIYHFLFNLQDNLHLFIALQLYLLVNNGLAFAGFLSLDDFPLCSQKKRIFPFPVNGLFIIHHLKKLK